MDVYHIRLMSLFRTIAATSYAVFSFIVALLLLFTVSDDAGSIAIAFVCTAVWIYSVYVVFRIANREVEATIYTNKLLMVLPKKFFFQSTNMREIHFADIAAYKQEMHEYSYIIIKLELSNGERYSIDPYSSMFKKIDDYSKLNFSEDLMAVFKDYTNAPGIITTKHYRGNDNNDLPDLAANALDIFSGD